MRHLVACTKDISSIELADLFVNHIWGLHTRDSQTPSFQIREGGFASGLKNRILNLNRVKIRTEINMSNTHRNKYE
jgi:hypothetical protein